MTVSPPNPAAVAGESLLVPTIELKIILSTPAPPVIVSAPAPPVIEPPPAAAVIVSPPKPPVMSTIPVEEAPFKTTPDVNSLTSMLLLSVLIPVTKLKSTSLIPAPCAVASNATVTAFELATATMVSTPVIRAHESSFAMVNSVAPVAGPT